MGIYDIYKLFRPFGEIFSLNQQPPPGNVHLEFATIADARINRICDNIILDGKEFSFRFDGYQKYDIDEDENRGNASRREMKRIAKYKNEMLETAPDADSPKNVLNMLNDHCLLEIFHKLNLHDLCAVANVCTRFKSIAINVFCSTYKKRKNVVRDLVVENRKSHPLSLAQIELFMRTFGPEVNAFEIDASKPSLILLGMCVDHCPKLQVLDVCVTPASNGRPHEHIRHLLPRLKQLKLASPYPVDDLFVGDWQLEMLHLINFDPGTVDTTIIKLPHLRELRVHSYYTELTEQLLVQLLSHTSQLHKLLIRGLTINPLPFKQLPQYLPNIHELTIESCKFGGEWEGVMVEWNELPSLKSLLLIEIDTRFVEMILQSLLLGEVSLKCLQIKSDITDNIIECIGQMPRIETIGFLKRPTIEETIRTIQQLPSLSTVIVSDWMYVDMMIRILQQIVQVKAGLFIRFQSSYSIHMDEIDCKKLAEFIQTHQETKIENVIEHEKLSIR